MKRYGLIGRSLAHSFSPTYFADLFTRSGLADHRYDAFELASIDELPELIRTTPELLGLNVTIPYKESVMPLLDQVDPIAAAVGAVNTIRIENGRTTGYNTDVEGFRRLIDPYFKGENIRALVLGSGGASRAVAFVLRAAGIRFRVVSRSRERGDISWDLLDPTIVKVCPLIINTTPLGMYPNIHDAPDLPYSSIGARHVLVDLIYNPEETEFLKNGKANGATTVNGLGMLHAQAEEAWRIWNA